MINANRVLVHQAKAPFSSHQFIYYIDITSHPDCRYILLQKQFFAIRLQFEVLKLTKRQMMAQHEKKPFRTFTQ